MKHLRYFKESVEDIGDIKSLDKYEYAEYRLENVSIDVTETDKKRITQLLESIYEPYEVFSVEITDFITGKNKKVSKGLIAIVAPPDEDGDILDQSICFYKFEDHYWLIYHNKQALIFEDNYWLVGDEDLNKIKNILL
jgi:hypothetical protein